MSGGPLEVKEHLNTPPASDPSTNKLRSSWENDILVTADEVKTRRMIKERTGRRDYYRSIFHRIAIKYCNGKRPYRKLLFSRREVLHKGKWQYDHLLEIS